MIKNFLQEIFGNKESAEIMRTSNWVKPAIRKMEKGEYLDVFGERKRDPWGNTNITPWIGGLDQMNWGYPGTGPYTLALNTLYHFTDGDEEFSYKHVFDFRADFLASADIDADLHIKADDIFSWINEKKKGAYVQ